MDGTITLTLQAAKDCIETVFNPCAYYVPAQTNNSVSFTVMAPDSGKALSFEYMGDPSADDATGTADFTVNEGDVAEATFKLTQAAGQAAPSNEFFLVVAIDDLTDDAEFDDFETSDCFRSWSGRDYVLVSILPGDWESQTDMTRAVTLTIPIATIQDMDPETNEVLGLTLGNVHVRKYVTEGLPCPSTIRGSTYARALVGWEEGGESGYVTILDDDEPFGPTGIEMVSSPANGNHYRLGEEITFGSTSTSTRPSTIRGARPSSPS